MDSVEQHDRIAILGSGGRIGRALLSHFGARATTDLVADVGAAVHVRIFTAEQAKEACAVAPAAIPLVFISTVAERHPARWADPVPANWTDEPWPRDDYGRNKRLAREAFESHWPGPVISLLFGGVIAPDSTRTRLQPLIERAKRSGVVRVPGRGDQRIASVTTADIARVVDAVTAAPADGSHVFQVAGPTRPSARDLIGALLDGAGVSARLEAAGRHLPEVPLSAADEIVNGQALQARWPDLAWDDPLEAMRLWGKRLATG